LDNIRFLLLFPVLVFSLCFLFFFLSYRLCTILKFRSPVKHCHVCTAPPIYRCIDVCASTPFTFSPFPVFRPMRTANLGNALHPISLRERVSPFFRSRAHSERSYTYFFEGLAGERRSSISTFSPWRHSVLRDHSPPV